MKSSAEGWVNWVKMSLAPDWSICIRCWVLNSLSDTCCVSLASTSPKSSGYGMVTASVGNSPHCQKLCKCHFKMSKPKRGATSVWLTWWCHQPVTTSKWLHDRSDVIELPAIFCFCGLHHVAKIGPAAQRSIAGMYFPPPPQLHLI